MEASNDPRNSLAQWANTRDEWTRYIVRLVLASGRGASEGDLDAAYQLFTEEKQIEPRTLPIESALAAVDNTTDREVPLRLTCIADVVGVNALKPGSQIDFNDGLTILFGENGTGKTGYARILKLLANSRTADEIIPDIHSESTVSDPHAQLTYRVGEENHSQEWSGVRGEAPFTRMSVFDTPAVNFHVDEDLTYVYTPVSLALFNHVTQGIQGVQKRLDGAITSLKGDPTALLARVNRKSTLYPTIETLGASSDLTAIQASADVGAKADEQLDTLRLAVAALRANTTSQEITIQQRRERALSDAVKCLTLLREFSVSEYDDTVSRMNGLRQDYAQFRETLFAAADLPSDPDDTWEEFIRSGQAYREHLEEQGGHDADRCIYCRQPLGTDAVALLTKYSEYLQDRIASDIQECETKLTHATAPLLAFQLSGVQTYVNEHAEVSDAPEEVHLLRTLTEKLSDLRDRIETKTAVGVSLLKPTEGLVDPIEATLGATTTTLQELRAQLENREVALAEKETQLIEYEARVELSKSWTEVSQRIADSKLADKLLALAKGFSSLLRQVTDLSKTASDQLINHNFEQLFEDECRLLRAPALRLEFVGRQGQAQRRKVLTGNYKPSKILSEGEQKVLAIADFLAEARLTGINAPIIFDDPVCSLDHRRINEVASRVALLAETTQVVVFTHDIFFVTNLLARFEKSKRCTYFQVTDEDGKGQITHATGPRWDTLSSLRANVNRTIEAAKAESGEARAALIRTAYDWIRAWCEVFVESDLLFEVTQRYQPNVRMTALPKIKAAALPEAIETVTRVFEDACRYIDGHSQPLASLGVAPTLAALEADWATLAACRKTYQEA